MIITKKPQHEVDGSEKEQTLSFKKLGSVTHLLTKRTFVVISMSLNLGKRTSHVIKGIYVFLCYGHVRITKIYISGNVILNLIRRYIIFMAILICLYSRLHRNEL